MSTTPKKPTVRSIAEVAGVSSATVSMALRNHPRVPVRTRTAIQKVARELGYVPNPYVSTLMAHVRTRSVDELTSALAFLNVFNNDQHWKASPFFTSVFIGAKSRAAELGYKLYEFSVSSSSRERVVDTLKARGIQGFVVSPMSVFSDDLVLPWEDFSVATVGYSITEPHLPKATPDQYQAIITVLDNLNQLGYARPGLVVDSPTMRRVNNHWGSGFLWHMHSNGRLNPDLIFQPEILNESKFLDWFHSTKPEVVLSSDIRVYDWMKKNGMRIPHDVGYVQLTHAEKEVGISGIDQRPELVGAAVIDLIEAQIHRNESGLQNNPKTILIEGKWVPGSTLRKVREMPVEPRHADHFDTCP